MSETLVRPDVGDAELISAVRGGDVSAYGLLFERHVESARRLARQLSPSDADDLVSDAFAKVLGCSRTAVVRTSRSAPTCSPPSAGSTSTGRGSGRGSPPPTTWRSSTPACRSATPRSRASRTPRPPPRSPRLPERWQLVLWHTEVEGQKPADIAPLLGMSANSVSALAYRAREGLRQAFLNSHIAELDDEHCEWTHEHLGAYVRHGVSKRDAAKVERHLDECRKCMAIYLELTEVNSNLSGILAPLLLGAAGSGYLASTAVAAKGGGALFLMAGRVRDGVTANTPLAAAAGVAAVATAVGITVALTINGNNEHSRRRRTPRAGRLLDRDPGRRHDVPPGPGRVTAPPRPRSRRCLRWCPATWYDARRHGLGRRAGHGREHRRQHGRQTDGSTTARATAAPTAAARERRRERRHRRSHDRAYRPDQPAGQPPAAPQRRAPKSTSRSAATTTRS